MDQTTFWKNFQIGEELQIAGRFIYNGLRCCHEMDSFSQEDEVFEFLYQLSVGLERLLKVAVVLTEHDNSTVQQDFEKSLVTHSHLVLLDRLQQKHNCRFQKRHRAFLQLLGKFYRSSRYGRFNVSSNTGLEKAAVHSFIEKYLGLMIKDDFPFNITPNSLRIKRFFGRVVGTMCTNLYEVVRTEARRLKIYTHEIRHDSKAAKIFLANEFTFENEDALVKELILYFMKSGSSVGHLGLLRRLAPLDFDIGCGVEHIQGLLSDEKKIGLLGELEALYENLDDLKQRRELLDLVGEDGLYFGRDSDDED